MAGPVSYSQFDEDFAVLGRLTLARTLVLKLDTLLVFTVVSWTEQVLLLLQVLGRVGRKVRVRKVRERVVP